jgi:hypothetical protein
MQAVWPVVHEKHVAATTDADGYSVPAAYAPAVERLVFGWQDEEVDVRADVAYQMRVTDRQQVMVPDISLYGLNDRLALGKTVAQLDSGTLKHRVDQIQDMSHDPFGISAFGPAPGVLVVEVVSG